MYWISEGALRLWGLYFSWVSPKPKTTTWMSEKDDFIYIYLYRKSAGRFSRGTVLNTLKQSRINIMRGKKDVTTFPDKPVSWIASLFRGLIIFIYIYIFSWWFISWESRPNLAFRKIKWTEHSGFVLQEPELYYISGKLLSFWTIHFQCRVRTVLGGSKPMRFHGPIMDTIIPKIGSNLTFESLWSISICFVRDWPVN